MEQPETATTTQPDTRGMIRDAVNESVAEAMSEIKALLSQTATKADVKALQDQIDAHQKAIIAHDGRIEDQKQRVDSLDQFKKTIEDMTGRMERSVSGAVELLNQRDEQYQKRMSALDERLSGNERRTAAMADDLHEVALADADTRKRLEEVLPPLQKEMFGDPITKRPGVLTTLETTNARINNLSSNFNDQLGAILVSLKPMIETHTATIARQQRRQARRQRILKAVFSWRGGTAIAASLPIVIPWAINWIQTHVNLSPFLLDLLTQLSKVISLYTGK